MSEVQDSGGGDKKKGKKIRAKKHSTHIDMTPMVDLAFLLLTFFLFTTTLNKPKAMPLIMPDNDTTVVDDKTKFPESNAMTIILSKNNRVFYYFGIREPKVEQASFDATKPNSIRKAIIEKKKECESRRDKDGKPERIMVLIKPDKQAKYRNIVDMLDEMNINSVPVYAIVDISPKEVAMIEGL